MKPRIGFLAVIGAICVAALSNAASADEAGCARLAGAVIPAPTMTLPTHGGKVTSATWESQPTSAYCKILGQIAPVDPNAPFINFQLNLPADWNDKAIQYGGGGMNGTLITGLAPLRDAPPGPTPLAQGFATFGTDGGHQAVAGRPLPEFALNDEALMNHAFGAYKKTRDAAVFLVASYYGRPQRRLYYIGGSEGGREAMLAVQRYPEDYDGAIATVPAISWVGYSLALYQAWTEMRDGAWLSPDALHAIQQSALDACDKADGLKDGVIRRYDRCKADTGLAGIACPKGEAATGGCLTAKQIALVKRLRAPYRYGFALANGETSYTGFPAGGEANPGALNPWFVSDKPIGADNPGDNIYAVGGIRYFITRDATFQGPLDPAKYKSRIQEISRLMDMTDPDLTRFKAHGGKLIIRENAADFLLAPGTVFRYFDAVRKRMGGSAVDAFARFYVAPWVTHGGPGLAADGKPAPSRVDFLAELDAWVEQGKAPAKTLTLGRYPTDEGGADATLPLCSYPEYPHYTGDDPSSAASFTCLPIDRPGAPAR